MANTKPKSPKNKKGKSKKERPTKLNMTFEDAISLSIRTKIPGKTKKLDDRQI